jgi:hypothetical protein
MMMIDEPGMFQPLEIWQQFLPEMEALPDFLLKDLIVEKAKWQIAQKKLELDARQ